MKRTQKNLDSVIRLTLLAILIWTTGCASMKNKMLVDNMRPMMESMRTVVNRSNDVDMVQAAMAPGLVQLDGLIGIVPDDDDLLLRASESYQGYAFAFLHDSKPALAAEYYKKAMDYALRVLKKNSKIRKTIGLEYYVFSDALKTLNKKDVPALYLGASAWMSWIGLTYKEKPEVLSELYKVIAMADRIIELDETYYHGGIHATLGACYASRPEKFGGQPKDAASQFEQAIDISGGKFLMWQVLYSQYYAVQIKDKSLFVSTLEKVLAAPDDLFVEGNFANALAKKKARRLLDQVNTLF